jgi:hypothetical protein
MSSQLNAAAKRVGIKKANSTQPSQDDARLAPAATTAALRLGRAAFLGRSSITNRVGCILFQLPSLDRQSTAATAQANADKKFLE